MSERLYTFVRTPGGLGMLDVILDGDGVQEQIVLEGESNEIPSIAFMNTVKSYCADNDPPLIMTSITPLAIQARPARSEVERTRARYSGDRLVSTDDFKQLIENAEQADHAAELSAEAPDDEREYHPECRCDPRRPLDPVSDHEKTCPVSVVREADAAESSDLRREEWVSARAGQLQRSGMGQGASRRQAREEAATMTFPSRFEFPYTTGASALSGPPTWHATRAAAEAWIAEQGPGSYYLHGPDEAAPDDEDVSAPARSVLDILRAAVDEEFGEDASPSQRGAATTAIRREGEPDEREHEIQTSAFRHCQDRDDLPDVVAIEAVMAFAMIADEYVSAVRADDDPVKLLAAEARLMRQIEPFLPNVEFDR